MRNRRRIAGLVAVVGSIVLLGCAEEGQVNGGADGGQDADPSDQGTGGDSGNDTDMGADSGGIDTGGDDFGQPDLGGTDSEAPWVSCVATGEESCGNGYDDDCDGLIDEACGCAQEQQQACYPGNPAHLSVPQTGCQAGTQTCGLEFWQDCEAPVGPVTEACDDAIDNDCDGEVDEDCAVELPEAICPEDFSGPVLREYTLEGGYFDPNDLALAVVFWAQLSAPPGHSRDLTPNGLDITFFADVAGDYRFQLTVENTAGQRDTCETVFTALTDDVLRIEMFWNPEFDETNATDASDVDLLLHRDATGNYDYYDSTDSCFWANCATCDEDYDDDVQREVDCRSFLAGSPPVDYPEGDPWPPPTLSWSPGGIETDPRLDLDDVEGKGPENINIRRPNAGTYRVAVHYYDDDGFGNAEVFVRILCSGETSYESGGVTLRDDPSSSSFRDNDVWEVGDLTISYDGEVPSCSFQAFGDADCERICTLEESEGGCPPAACEG